MKSILAIKKALFQGICKSLILVLLLKNMVLTSKDGFMYFEPLTFVPIDREAMDISLMTKKDMVRFNQYHKDVYEKISPFLDEKERIWLKEATQPF